MSENIFPWGAVNSSMLSIAECSLYTLVKDHGTLIQLARLETYMVCGFHLLQLKCFTSQCNSGKFFVVDVIKNIELKFLFKSLFLIYLFFPMHREYFY